MRKQLNFQTDIDEKRAFEECARREGMSLSAWIRYLLRQEASRVFERQGRRPPFDDKA